MPRPPAASVEAVLRVPPFVTADGARGCFSQIANASDAGVEVSSP